MSGTIRKGCYCRPLFLIRPLLLLFLPDPVCDDPIIGFFAFAPKPLCPVLMKGRTFGSSSAESLSVLDFAAFCSDSSFSAAATFSARVAFRGGGGESGGSGSNRLGSFRNAGVQGVVTSKSSSGPSGFLSSR